MRETYKKTEHFRNEFKHMLADILKDTKTTNFTDKKAKNEIKKFII